MSRLFRKPLRSDVVTVTTTSTGLSSLLTSSKVDDAVQRMIIQNLDASVTVYYGVGTVTTSTGGKIEPGERLAFPYQEKEFANLHFIVASGTASLFVLQEGHGLT